MVSREPFWGRLGAFWGSIGSPWGISWELRGGSGGEPGHRRPEGPSQTPRELSTPMVYNPQSTLESLLLLKEFDDFSVFAKNSHFENINFAWYVCRFRPYPKSMGATKKAPESTDDPH